MDGTGHSLGEHLPHMVGHDTYADRGLCRASVNRIGRSGLFFLFVLFCSVLRIASLFLNMTPF